MENSQVSKRTLRPPMVQLLLHHELPVGMCVVPAMFDGSDWQHIGKSSLMTDGIATMGNNMPPLPISEALGPG
jgi:hypothetical protein